MSREDTCSSEDDTYSPGQESCSCSDSEDSFTDAISKHEIFCNLVQHFVIRRGGNFLWLDEAYKVLFDFNLDLGGTCIVTPMDQQVDDIHIDMETLIPNA